MAKIRAKRAPKLTQAPEPPPVMEAPPVSKELVLAGERERALKRLGVTVMPFRVELDEYLKPAGGMVLVMDKIVPFIAQIDARYHTLLAHWLSASVSDRRALYPEDFLSMAKIDPADFIGEVARMSVKLSMNRGVLMSAMAHQEILETSLEVAKKPFGLKDREWHFKATGHLPLPKGAQINVLVNNQGAPQAPNAGNPTPGLPVFEQDAMLGSAVLRDELDRNKAPGVVDAEFEDVKE